MKCLNSIFEVLKYKYAVFQVKWRWSCFPISEKGLHERTKSTLWYFDQRKYDFDVIWIWLTNIGVEERQDMKLHRRSYISPCVWRNFPNLLFLRVSEMFGCWSSEIFQKKRNFWTREKFVKKFGNLSSEKSSDINQNCTSISKILKLLRKVWVFESKKPAFGSKSLEKRISKKYKSKALLIDYNTPCRIRNCFICNQN